MVNFRFERLEENWCRGRIEKKKKKVDYVEQKKKKRKEEEEGWAELKEREKKGG